ncbi:MAG: uridine kinase, partial [Candidatus Cloacimonadota bacterium]|nr:uridine kinase [Candidatus Cloacimonadota bacterium]
TGSGKTSITNAIFHEVGEHLSIIPQDSYYKDYSALSFDKRSKINFDHPNSIDDKLLIEHISSLKEKVPVHIPIYDFKTHSRCKETRLVQPTKIIVLEGILVFENKNLRDIMDIKIFVDTDADVRILRRIERDMQERGRSLVSIIDQYKETVRPMHNEFVEPSKRFADIIIPEGGQNLIGIDMILAKIKSII